MLSEPEEKGKSKKTGKMAIEEVDFVSQTEPKVNFTGQTAHDIQSTHAISSDCSLTLKILIDFFTQGCCINNVNSR